MKTFAQNFTDKSPRVTKLWSSILVFLFVAACTHTVSDESNESSEVSLKSDRQTIEELRKNIPEETRERNDELKEILNLMADVKKEPGQIRNQFSTMQSRRRDQYRRRTEKERRSFGENEKKQREKFLQSLKEEREKRADDIKNRQERKRFYDEIDAKRKEYFANEREARKNFESRSRQESKDFYAHQREQQKEFDAELRSYRKRYDDLRREKEEQRRKSSSAGSNQGPRGSNISQKDLESFHNLDQTQGTQLKAGSNSNADSE